LIKVTPAAVEALKKQLNTMGMKLEGTLIRLYVTAG
jgi:hypothetical protein